MFQSGKKKKYLIVTFSFLACALVYLCFFSERSATTFDPISSPPVNIERKVDVERKIIAVGEIKGSSFRRAESDIAVAKSWFEQHGIGNDAIANYEESYSNEQLESFISEGDIIAADVLASRYMFGGEIDKAHAIADKGIMLGSYNAIRMMANQFGPVLNEDDSDDERRENKESLMQYFVYLKLLQLRGGEELFSSQGLREYYLGNFKDIYGDDEPLSAGQYQLIDEKAGSLYVSYEDRRREMGWGPFDNDTAKAVNKAFSD